MYGIGTNMSSQRERRRWVITCPCHGARSVDEYLLEGEHLRFHAGWLAPCVDKNEPKE